MGYLYLLMGVIGTFLLSFAKASLIASFSLFRCATSCVDTYVEEAKCSRCNSEPSPWPCCIPYWLAGTGQETVWTIDGRLYGSKVSVSPSVVSRTAMLIIGTVTPCL
jgi:hypothetical protein